MPIRTQYQAKVEPLFRDPEVIPVDKWWQPASEPVRVKPRPVDTGMLAEPLAPHLRVVPSLEFVFPPQIPVLREHWNPIECWVGNIRPEDFGEMQWQQPQSQPVLVAAVAQQTFPPVEPFIATIPPEEIGPEKWTFIAPDPVRLTPRPVDTGFVVTSLEPTLTTAQSLDWIVQHPSAPPRIDMARYGHFVISPVTETVTVDKWFRQASEPVRVKTPVTPPWYCVPLEPSLTQTPPLGWLNQPPQLPVNRMPWARPSGTVGPLDPTVLQPPFDWLGQPIQPPVLPRFAPLGGTFEPLTGRAIPPVESWWRQTSEPVRFKPNHPEGGMVEPFPLFLDWHQPPQIPVNRLHWNRPQGSVAPLEPTLFVEPPGDWLTQAPQIPVLPRRNPEGGTVQPVQQTNYTLPAMDWLRGAPEVPVRRVLAPEGFTVEPIQTDTLAGGWQAQAAIVVRPGWAPLGLMVEPVAFDTPLSAWAQPQSVPVLPRQQTMPGWFVAPSEQTLYQTPDLSTWFVRASEPVLPRRMHLGFEQGTVEVWFVGQQVDACFVVAESHFIPGSVLQGEFVPGAVADGFFIPGVQMQGAAT